VICVRWGGGMFDEGFGTEREGNGVEIFGGRAGKG